MSYLSHETHPDLQRILKLPKKPATDAATATATTTTLADKPLPDSLPPLPVPAPRFLQHVAGNPATPVRELLAPYTEYENTLRRYLAQKPHHPFVADTHVNLVSVFDSENAGCLRIRERDQASESQAEKEKYIMPLSDKVRKKDNHPALVQTMAEFKTNFNVFTEGCLSGLDWSNIIVAGSAVLTPLLIVPPPSTTTNSDADNSNSSKRTLRTYYHTQFAPASDIDLFIHGLDNTQAALSRIAHIETTIRDNLLWETTTIRTRNTITIVSQYPNRHVQVVLRLYKSVSQILTGFDVNCSAFAYDGKHVWASPRALAAAITQCNDIDITRRSPSYENRLAKYAQRGFETYLPFLDRSRVDPTIFERSFGRTVGLARLLVLETFPTPDRREAYLDQRRQEMGRPARENNSTNTFVDSRNLKDGDKDEVAEWDFEDLSSYQKFVIPYGEGFNARNIERMFFKKDIVLNAEWNSHNNPPHRTVRLHRHPVFFGELRDVVMDCCGSCPEAEDEESKAVEAEESQIYVKGPISMLNYAHDDAGRQEVGSFYPLDPDDYTDMAYVSATARLCEAIVDNDAEFVRAWCGEEGNDVNARDYCGRTLLHLACLSASTGIEVVQALIDAGARIVARLQDGRTALHLAAARGSEEMCVALLRKSNENEVEKEEREEKKKRAGAEVEKKKKKKKKIHGMGKEDADEDEEMKDGEDDDDDDDDDENESEIENEDEEMASNADSAPSGFEKIALSSAAPTAVTDNDYVKISSSSSGIDAEQAALDDSNDDDDDIYDLDTADWDFSFTALHHAILACHVPVVRTLVSDFGANPSTPVRVTSSPKGTVLPLALASQHPASPARQELVRALLSLGASTAQSSTVLTAFHAIVSWADPTTLSIVWELDAPAATSVLNRVATNPREFDMKLNPLATALFQNNKKKEKEKKEEEDEEEEEEEKEKEENHHRLDIARDLLARGGHLTISATDILRSMRPKQRKALTHNNRPQTRKVLQPFERAVRSYPHETPLETIVWLLDSGADASHTWVSTWDVPAWRWKYDNHPGDEPTEKCPPMSGTAALDHVRAELKKAEDLLSKKQKQKSSSNNNSSNSKEEGPRYVHPASTLDRFPPDSYEKYIATLYWKKRISTAGAHNANLSPNAVRGRSHKFLADQKARFAELDPAEAERIELEVVERNAKLEKDRNRQDEWEVEMATQYIVDMKLLEQLLIERGAKTYYEQYPDAKVRYDAANPPFLKNDDNYHSNDDPEAKAKAKAREEELRAAERAAEEDRRKRDRRFWLPWYFEHAYLGHAEDGVIKAAYCRLFSAVWNNDVATVQELTSGPTGEGKERCPPLSITASDHKGNNLIHIAVRRGHTGPMLETLMQIANNQYEPDAEQRHMIFRHREDEDCSDSQDSNDLGEIEQGESDDDDDQEVVEGQDTEKHVVPDEFRSAVSAYSFLTKTSDYLIDYLLPADVPFATTKFCSTNSMWSPLSAAIYRSDLPLIQKLAELANANAVRASASDEEDEDEKSADAWKYFDPLGDMSQYLRSWETRNPHLALALRLPGKISVLEELMKSFSFGVWYGENGEFKGKSKEEEEEEEAEAAGGQDGSKAKNKKKEGGRYKGLTVRGGKKKDWVRDSHPTASGHSGNSLFQSWGQLQKPMHTAVYEANMEAVQWLLSERPWVCLQEFMHRHPNSRYTSALRKHEAAGRLHHILDRGLGLMTSLLPHIALAGWSSYRGNRKPCAAEPETEEEEEQEQKFVNEQKYVEMFNFCLDRCGHRRDSQGRSPLLVATELRNLPAVHLLLTHPSDPADIRSRDNNGHNVLHTLIGSNPGSTLALILPQNPSILRAWLSVLVDKAQCSNHNNNNNKTEMWTEIWSERTSPDLHTPLSQLLALRDGYPQLSFLKALLDSAPAEATARQLTLPNARGDLPIHTASLEGAVDTVQMLLERAPQTIAAENANGRTVAEIAAAQRLRGVADECNDSYSRLRSGCGAFEHVPHVPHQSSHVSCVPWNGNALEKKKKQEKEEEEKKEEEEVWVPEGCERDETRQSAKSVKRLLKLANESMRGYKRKLVGLKEAGELVRRLQRLRAEEERIQAEQEEEEEEEKKEKGEDKDKDDEGSQGSGDSLDRFKKGTDVLANFL